MSQPFAPPVCCDKERAVERARSKKVLDVFIG